MTTEVEQYILDGRNARLRNQRLLNILLVRLDKGKDYIEFCKLLQLTSVLSNLNAKMISGIVHMYKLVYNFMRVIIVSVSEE